MAADATDPTFDAFAHGSLGTLAPSWWEEEPDENGNVAEPEPWLSAETAFERFLSWVEARGITPWTHQEDALFALAAGSNVILGTPTGSGKSLVAIGELFLGLATGKRGYYTAPIKALVSEKFFQLVDIFGRDNVGMVTGDSHINTKAPIICCTAEILANQALAEGADADVGLIAMDEFHFFADPDRGWAWQVPLLTLPHAQFLLMSATLGDMSAIAATLERETGREVERILNAPRPVPLSYQYVKTALEATVELALRQGDAPLYIVHFSQDAALTSARALASYGVATKEQREAIKEALHGARFNTAFGKTLKHLISCGVGLHHAGLLPRYRLLVEKLAQQGLLPVICGTDTLGVGINVPIHTVVLTGLTKFDGVKQRRLRSREFHQIAGRAGRSGFDTEGVVIAEAPEHEIENYKAELKAMSDPKKMKRLKKKKAPEGFVTWNEATFTRLIDAPPETLRPRLRVTHSMVLAEVEQGGDARARVDDIIDRSLQSDEEKAALHDRAAEIFAILIDAGVVVQKAVQGDGPNPATAYELTVDLPEDFALDRTVPADKKTPQLDDVVAWLGLIVRSVDSSLVDEWAAAGQPIDAAPPKLADEVVADRRGLTVLVRNALFHRVRLAARDRADELGALDEDWGFGTLRWKRVLDAFYEAHDELLTDADARSAAYLSIDEADEKTDHVWHVHQVFADADGDHDFGIMADVDLNATQDGDGVVFKNYKAGVIEELVS